MGAAVMIEGDDTEAFIKPWWLQETFQSTDIISYCTDGGIHTVYKTYEQGHEDTKEHFIYLL